MRKIAQIATFQDTPNTHPAIVGLCDDGSVWCLALGQVEWNREPDIPQDEPVIPPDYKQAAR
jgi:hypothetical protein